MTKDIEPELLRKLLRYEPETGKLFWLARPREMFISERLKNSWNTQCSGKEAFTAKSKGYKVGSIIDRMYKAHRVIWAIQTGEWPKFTIDHADMCRDNNIWSNLRAASVAENNRNRASNRDATSRMVGVCWCPRRNKWRATLGLNGKQMWLGYHVDEVLAAKAYDSAAKVAFGEFARLNFRSAAS